MSVHSILPGGSCAGFQLINEAPLPDLNLHLLQMRHNPSGARMVHLACEDPNNLFAATFRTPPSDSTGVAHILEHTVLCGSQRYPVRDPFFAMLKRSLSTFMNALTASDWTSYPFASQNSQDFHNLLGIYLDACFFPLLRQSDFLQEGHRLEYKNDNPEGELQRQGVVYNEMKGAMASPSSLLGRRLNRALYPTTTYHHNSGGEPSDIPQLTWQGLRDFHKKFYHPSNAWLFSYGNGDLCQRLEYIDDMALRHFSARAIDSEVEREPRLDQPRRVTETFPLEAREGLSRKSMIQVAWLTCDIEEGDDRLALNLLSLLLLGNPAAPLYKALLDSGLGDNLAPGCGYHDDYRSTYFAVGLQGTDPEQVEAIEELILETLNHIAKEGFTRERIDGALQRFEFSNREVSGDHYPYPLALLMRILGTWLHNDDPVSPLCLGENLVRLRSNFADKNYLGYLIKRYLLDNPHRITLLLRPDPDEQKDRDQRQQRELAAVNRDMNPEARLELVRQSQALRAEQDREPDSGCLPCLGRQDIPASEEPVSVEEHPLPSGPVYLMPQPTNGINYLHLLLPADQLSRQLVPVLPLLGTLLNQIGANDLSYLEMSRRIERFTGGISASPEIHDGLSDLGDWKSLLTIKGKSLPDHFPHLLTILQDLLKAPDFSQKERLAQIIGQMRVSMENSIPGSGHSYAARMAAASLSPVALRREQWSGLSLLRRVRQLSQHPAEDLGALVADLQKIAVELFCRNNIKIGITSEPQQMNQAHSNLLAFIEDLPEKGSVGSDDPPASQAMAPRRGFCSSLPVAYCAQVFPCVAYTDPAAPALQILAKLLRSGFLHQEIREKGGAYGGLAGYNAESGQFSFLSYRDPHISRTLDVFQGAAEWAAAGKFSQQDIDEAVLATFSDLDRPLSPGSRGAQEFSNLHQGLSGDMRQDFRQHLLAVDKKTLQQAAEIYLVQRRGDSAVAVLASRDMLERENRKLGSAALELEDL